MWINAAAPSVIEGEMAKGFDERRASYMNGAIVPVNGGALMSG